MWGHSNTCACRICQCLPRICQLVAAGIGYDWYDSFVTYASTHLRQVEGELRDELGRRGLVGVFGQVTRAAPPAPPPLREEGTASQTGPAPCEGTAPLNLATKAHPPLPPPHLAPGPEKASSSATKEEPLVKKESHQVPVPGETAASPKKERERSRPRRPEASPPPEKKGERRSPRKSEKSKRRSSRDRDRKRRRSTSSRERRQEGGRERKRKSEKPPEPEGPPPSFRSRSSWEPREPAYPPRGREGGGWRGELPISDHPRWTESTNKGQVKRAKQELHSRRHYR